MRRMSRPGPPAERCGPRSTSSPTTSRPPRSAKPLRKYDGYTVMPITVSRRELMLLEVDREGRPQPSTPSLDLTKPRRSTWLFDRYALKAIYFRRILRGKA